MHARRWLGSPQPCPQHNESRARLPRGWLAGSLLVYVFVINGLFDHIIKRLRYLGGSFRRQCYIEPISMLLWASRDHAELQKCRHALSQLRRQAIPQKGFFLKHASDGLHKKNQRQRPSVHCQAPPDKHNHPQYRSGRCPSHPHDNHPYLFDRTEGNDNCLIQSPCIPRLDF